VIIGYFSWVFHGFLASGGADETSLYRQLTTTS
jgi:hypothetical protein